MLKFLYFFVAQKIVNIFFLHKILPADTSRFVEFSQNKFQLFIKYDASGCV